MSDRDPGLAAGRRICKAEHVRAGAAGGREHADGLRAAAARWRAVEALVHQRAAPGGRRRPTSTPRWSAQAARRSAAVRRCATRSGRDRRQHALLPTRAGQSPRLRSATPGTRSSVQRTGLNTEAKLLLLGACLRDAAVRSRSSSATQLVQPALAHGDRAPGRQAGRRAAQPPAPSRTAACATPWCSRSSTREWPAVKRNLDSASWRARMMRLSSRSASSARAATSAAELIRLIAAHPRLRAGVRLLARARRPAPGAITKPAYDGDLRYVRLRSRRRRRRRASTPWCWRCRTARRRRSWRPSTRRRRTR